MEVITAPTKDIYNWKTSVFLAGGITDCPDWQSEVIKYLEKYDLNTRIRLKVYNPRRKNFDIHKDSAEEQIKWEYDMINRSDIFSMYFCNSDSVQPICMYELGVRIGRIAGRGFDHSKGYRTIISIEDGYKRADDVIIQVGLALPDMKINLHATPASHAQLIIEEYNNIKKYNRKNPPIVFDSEVTTPNCILRNI